MRPVLPLVPFLKGKEMHEWIYSKTTLSISKTHHETYLPYIRTSLSRQETVSWTCKGLEDEICTWIINILFTTDIYLDSTDQRATYPEPERNRSRRTSMAVRSTWLICTQKIELGSISGNLVSDKVSFQTTNQRREIYLDARHNCIYSQR